jgi:hypothetical protein
MSGIFSLVAKETVRGSSSKYIEAISYDRSILEPMLDSLKKKYNKHGSVSFFIEADTKIIELYSCESIKNTTLNFNTRIKSDNSCYGLPFYSVLQIQQNKRVVNYLLDIQSFSYESAKRLMGNKISSSPISFDVLYDDGTINA